MAFEDHHIAVGSSLSFLLSNLQLPVQAEVEQ